ncbi:hypothetical protein L5515_009167 [Caenorhabditis briggsae]|uniref:F-box domain-containing protein n=2 Tax=Caenorhabditis briggsae TaxID=6238 RepID=A0AAE9JND2_CAEBR|nr:hypothetical protein L5515_009167 [Caenorhabditis briggsae]
MSLQEIPEKVLNNLMNFLDFREILTLRSVSHNLRNHIDKTKPDFSIILISIHADFNNQKNQVWLKTQDDEHLQVAYQKEENGTQLAWDQKSKFLENVNYSSVFFNDFSRILDHQKSVLTEIKIAAHVIPEDLKKVLKSRKSPIKANKLLMETTHQSQVLEVLPFMDIEFLKEIGIYEIRQNTVQELWKIDKIVETSYWKKAENFESLGFHVDVSVENFKHFSKGTWSVSAISAEDLDFLKTNFLQLPTFKFCVIYYQILKNLDQLLELFGAPFIIYDLGKENQKRWYFKFPDNSVLNILLVPSMIFLTRIEKNEVPEGAEIVGSE